MKALTAGVLVAAALVLAAPARAAINDTNCAASIALAVMDGQCEFWDDAYKYNCPDKECKERLSLIAGVCLAEGYRLADQVLAAAKAMEAAQSSGYPSSAPSYTYSSPTWANATADNVTGLILACGNVPPPA